MARVLLYYERLPAFLPGPGHEDPPSSAVERLPDVGSRDLRTGEQCNISRHF